MTTPAIIERRLFGPPGTGKTTTLTKHINLLAHNHGPDSMMVASFTKTAAVELGGKDLDINPEMLGTLHSLCYRALGRPTIAEKKLKDWNTAYPHYALTVGGGVDINDPYAGEGGGETNTADDLLNRMNHYRARMIPEVGWSESVRAFAQCWNDWKYTNDYLDFTDLIEKAMLRVDRAPGDPRFGIYDEVQDFTPLQLALIRKWAQHMDYILLGGDDDQASLPGTMVTVEGGGTVPVETLVAGRDRLVSYDQRAAKLNGLGRGHVLQEMQRSHYAGHTACVSAGDHRTRTTHNHPWLARWSARATTSGACVVYLMRQGVRWRIGWCQLMRADGVLHLGARARVEKADAAWILHVTENRDDASATESFLAAQYGIPTICFEPVDGRGHQSRDVIDAVFDRLDPDEQRTRAQAVLASAHRDIEFPFYQSGMANRSGATIFQVKACNLLSDYMEVPVVDGKSVTWFPLTVTWSWYEGDVYGLLVGPYHTYIADGIVTHNCIYDFTGASPYAFLDPPIPEDQKIILNQSRRVPRAVQAYAQAWIEKVGRREMKVYAPRDFEGDVLNFPHGNFKFPEPIVEHALRYIAETGKTVMFLASCGYMLQPILSILRRESALYHNPYRLARGDWNPIRFGALDRSDDSISSAERLLCLLRPGQPDGFGWTGDELYKWSSVMKAEGVFVRGAKKVIEGMRGDANLVPFDTLLNLFTADAWDQYTFGDGFTLDWFAERLVAGKAAGMEYPLRIAKTHGPMRLKEKPKIIVGTIHSVKGGEADRVYLFPDISRAAGEEWLRVPSDSHDALIRTYYVGMTRARESLVICPQFGYNRVELPYATPGGSV